MSFFDRCEVPTSPFIRKYAETDEDWKRVVGIHEQNIDRTPDGKYSIPKIIHFIWVGSELPLKYQKIVKEWKAKNPEFEIVIWDDDKIKQFRPSMINGDLFDNAPRLGGKSDIVRYEILKKHGGLYVDTDYLCKSNFSDLHDRYSFYTGITLEKPVVFNNGILASAPNHPILDICIGQMTLENPWNISCPETLVMFQTGPWAFTKSVLHYINGDYDHDGTMLFPTQVFHPFPPALRFESDSVEIDSYCKPWTRACHLWHCSWQPNSKFYRGGNN